MKKNGFRKSERICSQILIDELFSKGKELRKFPFIVKFILTDFVGEALEVVISVPKRRAKKAVDRNKLKRQIREAWRLNNHELKQDLLSLNKNLKVFLIYTGKEKEAYSFIAEKLNLILTELRKNIQ